MRRCGPIGLALACAIVSIAAHADSTRACGTFVHKLPNVSRALCEEARLTDSGARSVRGQPLYVRDVAPPDDATLQQLFDAIDWVAPGFEVVQSHCPGWSFSAPDTVADGGLHARLLVGRRVPVRDIAPDAAGLEARLAAAQVTLSRDGQA